MKEYLFVYGTLAPNRPNHHIISCIEGVWMPATTTGYLIADGWGAALGYPALIPKTQGERVQGFVFASDSLSAHWDRLDAFEGDGYERVLIKVQLDTGEVLEAFVYALSQKEQAEFAKQGMSK
ncbi:MAG: gamma-glutamylcyclotransferase family protein [Moraxella sp.]|nr:gamma-glutamylcyclotransferase family protein [Moraxella sp.]